MKALLTPVKEVVKTEIQPPSQFTIPRSPTKAHPRGQTPHPTLAFIPDIHSSFEGSSLKKLLLLVSLNNLKSSCNSEFLIIVHVAYPIKYAVTCIGLL